MENIKLFKNLKEYEIDILLGVLGTKTKIFKKGQTIVNRGEKLSHIMTVLVGEVKILTENLDGTEGLIGVAQDGETFCANLVCAKAKMSPIKVVAQKQTGVLFLPYDKMFLFNPEIADIQTQLLKNILEFTAKENDEINFRLYCLDKTTIREKILAYLNFEAQKVQNTKFEIAMSREELSNYLCVDRSAMCRELSNMQKAGLIEYKKNEFELLNKQAEI